MATTSENLALPLMNQSGQDGAEILFNEAIQVLDALGYGVPSSSNAPPGSPAENDIVLVGASPTGAFAGNASKLAIYRNGAWIFYSLPVFGYSTTETLLPRLRESKPVYSKVIEIAAGPGASATVTTAHSITGLDLSNPVGIQFYAYDGSNAVEGASYLDGLFGWEVSVDGTNVIWASNGNDYSGWAGRAHLRYAKT